MDRVDLHWKRIVSADQKVGIICRLGQMWLPTFSSLHNLCLLLLTHSFSNYIIDTSDSRPTLCIVFPRSLSYGRRRRRRRFSSSLCYSLSGYLFFRLSHCQKKLVSFYSLYSYSLLDYLKGGAMKGTFIHWTSLQ